MTDSTGGSLNAAYEAIKAKDLAKARDVLSAYLVDHPNDVDAWWLYSYAVTDVEQGRRALETVLRLDPAYPGARDLLNELEKTHPSPVAAAAEAAGIRSLPRLGDGPLTATISPEDDDVEFGFADEKAPESAGSSLRRILVAALAAIAVLAIVFVVFILPNLNPAAPAVVANTTVPPTDPASAAATDAPTADSATDVPTDAASTQEQPATESASPEPPTQEPAASDAPTTEAATLESPTQQVPTETAPNPTTAATPVETFDAVYAGLTGFEVVPDSAAVEQTDLGQTVVVSVCTILSELRTVIPATLAALARTSAQLSADTEAVGAKFVNCIDNSLLRYVALDISDALAFANGSLTEAELRSRFVPLP